MNLDALTLGGILVAFLVAGLLIAIERSNTKASQLRRRMRGCGLC